MRLLFLCGLPPCPPNSGGAQRQYHLLHALSQAHDVDLAYVARGPQAPDPCALYEQCRRVVPLRTDQRRVSHHRVGLPPGRRLLDVVRSPRPGYVQEWRGRDLIAGIRALRSFGPYDGVWVQRAFLASAARSAGFKADVVDVDDIDSDKFQQRLALLGRYKSRLIDVVELAKIRAYERTLTYRYQALVVCKEEDRQFFAHPSRCHVIPNGARVPPASSLGAAPKVDFLFIGSISYWPNKGAVEWFVAEILPLIRQKRPQATFLVAGRSADRLASRLATVEGCTVISDPPEVDPLYRQARVVVVPMRLGSGTCIKSLEALAFARPLVSTSAGVKGLGLVDGRHAAIADSPEAFAGACLRLLSEPETGSLMGARGREHVEKNFSWDACAPKAVTLIESVVREKAHGTLRIRSGGDGNR